MAILSATVDAMTSGGRAESLHLAGRHLSRSAVAAAALAIALLVLVPRRAWRIGRLVVTAVHEGGHSVAAVMVGRKVGAVHLHADTSGVTFHAGLGGRAARLTTAAAGYPAPGLVALAGALAITRGYSDAWLVALLVLALVNVVLWVRNLFGIFFMCLGAGALAWLIADGTEGVDALVGAVVVWSLAIGGLRAAIELLREAADSDAREVGRLLHLPAVVCKAAFIVSASAAVVAVSGLLLGGW